MTGKSVAREGPELLHFEIVTETYSSPTQTRRKGAGATIERSGYGETNTNGTGEVDKLITPHGNTEDQFSMKFGANRAKGLIAGYMAKDGEAGATTVRRSKSKKSILFHIGHTFDKYPTLRPSGTVFCTLKESKDAKGVPCIIINLRGGVAK
ncbi:MAG TPA: hypothetical protein VGK74_00245 [Symbiobacteriaceae bacterium]|jgi:hypothetical protein